VSNKQREVHWSKERQSTHMVGSERLSLATAWSRDFCLVFKAGFMSPWKQLSYRVVLVLFVTRSWPIFPPSLWGCWSLHFNYSYTLCHLGLHPGDTLWGRALHCWLDHDGPIRQHYWDVVWRWRKHVHHWGVSSYC
jgi:hypothetical protein